MAVANVTAGLDRARAGAAARYLSAQMAVARAQAIKRSASVAIRFGDRASGFEMAMFLDGNGNGVRTADINVGVDSPLQPPDRLERRFPGVTIDLASGVDPSGGPVRFGASSLLTFTPHGTATSGSVYVLGRDATQYAVRVLGATARTRVVRYLASSGTWVER